MRNVKHRQAPRPVLGSKQSGIGFELGPVAFGMGGESPILVRTKDGKVHAIAGVGTMPKLATADFFRNHKLRPDEIVEPPEKNGLKDWVPAAGVLAAV